jgi:hypothetical protein
MMAKAGLTVRQVNLAVEKKVKNVEVILPVDQQKLNVPQRLKRKLVQKELAGKTVGQKNQKVVS